MSAGGVTAWVRFNAQRLMDFSGPQRKRALAGENVTQWKPHQRVRAGVAYVPQGRDIFPRLTVEENLLLGLSRFQHRGPT